MAAQTTVYWDKDIYFIGCLITRGAYHHLMGEKGIKNLNEFMKKIVFLRIWYIQVSILLENLYPVRDRPFDFQCGGGWDFFFEKNSLFPYREKKKFY